MDTQVRKQILVAGGYPKHPQHPKKKHVNCFAKFSSSGVWCNIAMVIHGLRDLNINPNDIFQEVSVMGIIFYSRKILGVVPFVFSCYFRIYIP